MLLPIIFASSSFLRISSSKRGAPLIFNYSLSMVQSFTCFTCKKHLPQHCYTDATNTIHVKPNCFAGDFTTSPCCAARFCDDCHKKLRSVCPSCNQDCSFGRYQNHVLIAFFIIMCCLLAFIMGVNEGEKFICGFQYKDSYCTLEFPGLTKSK